MKVNSPESGRSKAQLEGYRLRTMNVWGPEKLAGSTGELRIM